MAIVIGPTPPGTGVIAPVGYGVPGETLNLRRMQEEPAGKGQKLGLGVKEDGLESCAQAIEHGGQTG